MKCRPKSWYQMTDDGRAMVWQASRDEKIARGKANYARYGQSEKTWDELSWKEQDRWITFHKEAM